MLEYRHWKEGPRHGGTRNSVFVPSPPPPALPCPATGVPPVATTAPADLDGFSSPVAVSLSYNLPNFVDLSDSYGQPLHLFGHEHLPGVT